MPRNCLNSVDNVCYLCGEVTFAKQRKAITTIVKNTCTHLYFGCKNSDQAKSCVPHICCRRCARDLSQWLNGKRNSMPFAIPMVWREPSNHASDCYFCRVPPVSGGITKKNKWTIVYPNIRTICSPFSSERQRNFRFRTSERIYHRFRRRGQRQVDLGFSWAAGVYWTSRLPR
jgi:hypothetical protein